MHIGSRSGSASGSGDGFDPDRLVLDGHIPDRRQIGADLRVALADDQFVMFYQPIIHIASCTIRGFEALLRWDHPERGMIVPGDFIAVAEETGLIKPIGAWAMHQACVDAMGWPDDLRVAVNLSPAQFNSETFLDDVSETLRAAGLPARRLSLEITEASLLGHADAVFATLNGLRDRDIGIALDDFGTGSLSLRELGQFRFTTVKIDRSVIAGLGDGGGCDTIVGAVVDQCDRLGMGTTSEGVETEAQLETLAAFHCMEAQGYLFSRPRPVSEVGELYRRFRRRVEMAG